MACNMRHLPPLSNADDCIESQRCCPLQHTGCTLHQLQCRFGRQADAAELRRLKVASHVYDAWTARGTRIAQLADRFAASRRADCTLERSLDVLAPRLSDVNRTCVAYKLLLSFVACRFIDGSVDALGAILGGRSDGRSAPVVAPPDAAASGECLRVSMCILSYLRTHRCCLLHA